jgi:thymidine kinase
MNIPEPMFTQNLEGSNFITPEKKHPGGGTPVTQERKELLFDLSPALENDGKREILFNISPEQDNDLETCFPELLEYFGTSDEKVQYDEWALGVQHRLFRENVVPTPALTLPASMVFLEGSNPDEVCEDLWRRHLFGHKPHIRASAGIIPGITEFRFSDYRIYDPFHFGESVGLPDYIEKEIIRSTLRAIDLRLSRSMETICLMVPDANNVFFWQEHSPDTPRVDLHLAYDVKSGEIANCILGMELHICRKLIPVLIVGGMKSGKSATIMDLYDRWPAPATKVAYTFSGNCISSRSGRVLDATRIKTFGDIIVAKIRRSKCNFPALIIIDEMQFGDPETLEIFLEECQWYNIKVILSGIPYNLRSQVWPAVALFKQSFFRTVLYIHSQCEICGEITPELNSQLRKRPTFVFQEDLPEKTQWITTCIPCSTRYFPYCHVSNKSRAGLKNKRYPDQVLNYLKHGQ